MLKAYIINGSGESGKDKLIEYISNIVDERFKLTSVVNYSTIEPVKDAIEVLGWKIDDKSDEARNFMSEVKDAWKKFNNGPNNETIELIKMLLNDIEFMQEDIFLFIHCREPEDILELIGRISSFCPVKTINLKRIGHSIPNCIKDDPERINAINYDMYYMVNTKEDLMNVAIDFVNKEKF